MQTKLNSVVQSDVFTIKHISSIRKDAGVPLSGVEWSTTMNAKGVLEESDKVPYDSTIFTQTKQVIGFPFSLVNGYKLAMSDEDLQKEVPKCKLIYKSGLRIGQIIDSANHKDPRDPFFTAEELKISLDDFETSYDYTEPINKIKYALMKADPRFLVLENVEELPDPELISYKVEFIVSRKSFTMDAKLKKSVGIREALQRLEVSQLKELKTVAIIWSIDFNEDTSEKNLKDQIGFYLIENKKIPNSDQTYLQSYLELMNMNNRDLAVKAFVREGIRSNVIRATRNGFSFNNIHLGMDMNDVEEFFRSKDEENVKTFLALEMKLKGKEGQETS